MTTPVGGARCAAPDLTRGAPESPTAREVSAEFQDVSDSELLGRCLKLCQAYRISASELSTQWDLLQMNTSLVGGMTLDSLAELERIVRDSQSKKRHKSDPKAQFSRPAGAAGTFTKDSAHLLQLGSVMGARSPLRARACAPPAAPSLTSPARPPQRARSRASPAPSWQMASRPSAPPSAGASGRRAAP